MEEKKSSQERRPFDPDLAPENQTNRDAARQLDLVYDRRVRVYRDSDGCPVRDRFGQPIG